MFVRTQHRIIRGKDIVIHQEPEDHGQFTRMLDLDNEWADRADRL